MVDRLIDLIKEAVEIYGLPTSARLADHLLLNGVIVPPVGVGQVVYYTYGCEVKEAVVEELRIDEFYNMVVIRDTSTMIRRAYPFEKFGKSVFNTRKEAEKCLNL